jgi:protease-4
VVDGKTRRHPLLGEAVGSETFTAEVEKLRKARRVKGVVLRINSGGGSATASEDVLSALRRLAKEKPLVISMSEAAGSGGYWIACTGERLFVRETSLTGSIGVLVMLLSARTLLERLGITGSVIKSAEHADMGSVLRPPTETERKAVDTLVEAVYRDFISRVAGARALQRPRVERLAEGRIWSGRDAVARGLADETGGVTEAVDYLRRRLGLRRATVRFYPDTRPGLLQRIVLRRPGSAEQLLGAVSSAEEAAALNAAPLAVMPHSLLDIPRGR